ncbi:MAG: GntR family transcriptional regulator [Victivallales bacterium]|nr:GntR family transcriptional regulator [Victivallales bacterium]
MKIRRYVMNLILRSGGETVRIPTFQELSEKFRVSRPTVNRAMKELVSEGYIVSRRGIGSFTNPAQMPISIGKKLPVIGIVLNDGLVVHLAKYFGLALAEFLKQVVSIPAVAHLVTVGTTDPELAAKEIMDDQLDALITFGGGQFVPHLRESGLRIVVSDYASSWPGSVIFDYEDWGYRCGRQLLKENRKNIVFLHDKPSWNTSFPGFRKAFAEAGVPLNENFFLKNSQTCLDELANMIRYGIQVDAVCDTAFINNEVSELLVNLNPELVETCAIIHNALAVPPVAKFHEICYDIPFAKLAEEVAELLKFQLEDRDEGMDLRKVYIPMIIR